MVSGDPESHKIILIIASSSHRMTQEMSEENSYLEMLLFANEHEDVRDMVMFKQRLSWGAEMLLELITKK